MLTLEATGSDGTVVAIEFDVSEREGYEAPAEITEHAVEQGAAVTDNVRPGNDTLTLEAFVSNTPIVVPGTQMDGASAVTTRSGVVRVGNTNVPVTALQWSQQFDRVRGVDTLLRAWRDAGQLLTVTTSLRTLENYVIERYRLDRDAENGDGLPVVLDLKRVRLVTTQRVPVTAPRHRRGQHQQQRGAQPGRTTDTRSTLARAGDAARERLRRLRQ